MRNLGIFLATLVLAFSVVGCGSEKQESQKGQAVETSQVSAGGTQTVCPVMGGKIDKQIYTDYEGKRVYFCCEACVAEFKKDPERYVGKMEAEGVVLEKAPGASEMPGHETAPGEEHAGHGHD